MPINPGDMPVLFDAVTLQNATSAGRLELFEALYGHRPEPRWTEQVQEEVRRGATMLKSVAWCRPILDHEWLGEAFEPNDLALVLRLQTAMTVPGKSDEDEDEEKNLGEAQCIAAAIELDAVFVTDDRGAYTFAKSRLGPARVKDFCQLLFEAAEFGTISRSEVADVHLAVSEAGRSMLCARHGSWS
jgi:hypothetical protein